MKRKLAIMALTMAMVVSNIAPSTAMVAHAAENDEIGDILDDVFGGNKPDNSQGEGTTGGGTDEIDWSNKPQNSDDGGSGSDDGGSTDTGNSGSDNSGSENTGSGDEDDEIGDILDDIFGGSKPDNSGGSGTTGGGTDEIDWSNKPQNGGSDNSGSSNTGNTGNSGSNGGSSNSGSNSGSNAGSSTTVTDPDTGKLPQRPPTQTAAPPS